VSESSAGFTTDVRAVVSKKFGRRRAQFVSPRESTEVTLLVAAVGVLGVGTALFYRWRHRQR
jgi:hypothetical protein